MPRQRVAPDLFDEDEGGFGRGALATLGRVVSAHPSLAGGTVAFTVIFSFVAANALWAQPGRHPAPILKTREVATSMMPATAATPESRMALAEGAPTRSVTTYRIEHSDNTQTASIPVPNAAPARVQTAVQQAPTPAQAVSKTDPVLSRMQQILSANGLYDGEVDGLMGPKSAAAIRAWENANGYVQTGEATPGLLAVMETPAKTAAPVKMVSLDKVVRPKPRPEPTVAADQRAGEPVTEAAAEVPAVSELVRQIQSGLSNIAYADIAVDGVAGTETRNAISAFEKHYRLPVTGQPNQTVLKKLLEIGAL
ncbi:peptidoglycan-binding protein [Hoeflea sp. G2-23]|uniref:Peptidoglycan-binding protein n=1 Tax=Hoeflea algicola TaxID=2983763 RepID=A0ABT3Z3K8_9HYPH|nr:peptidoglycan-binding domain-containing protein [Hoeflea algicola]MCY0146311.1 peptidoglycan-binding protein [Hoeflea algicola]